MIRLPIPSLSEERRNEIKKMTKSMGEQCKISIRNIRREANEELKKLLDILNPENEAGKITLICRFGSETVSYTHLTLPTIYSV